MTASCHNVAGSSNKPVSNFHEGSATPAFACNIVKITCGADKDHKIADFMSF